MKLRVQMTSSSCADKFNNIFFYNNGQNLDNDSLRIKQKPPTIKIENPKEKTILE